MKTIVSADGPTLNANVAQHLTNCPYLTIVADDGSPPQAIENPVRSLSRGRALRLVEWIERQGAAAVMTGHCGAGVRRRLAASGIALYAGCGGTIEQSLARRENVELADSTAVDDGGGRQGRRRRGLDEARPRGSGRRRRNSNGRGRHRQSAKSVAALLADDEAARRQQVARLRHQATVVRHQLDEINRSIAELENGG